MSDESGAVAVRLTESEREALVERVAERISWDGGDFTRWSENAHPDHTRWSWRGDGHGPVMREVYRQQAEAAVDELTAAVEAIVAARLARVAALADEWEHVGGGDDMGHDFAAGFNFAFRDHAALLRAALADGGAE